MSKEVNFENLLEEIRETLNLDEDYQAQYAILYGDYDENQSDFEHISKDGGGEGGGEYVECVFKFKGVFYKVTLSYYSYHGYEWGDACAYEVTPQQRTITVYE